MRFEAGAADIDMLGHVNNTVFVRWIQEIAIAHWSKVASATHQVAYIWVVTRHEIDYLRSVGLGEIVTGRTWVGDAPHGARFDRHVEFTNGDGKACVRAKTSWAIIDRASGRPIRVPAEVAAPFLA